MDQKSSRILFKWVPGLYMIIALLYIIIVLRPVFYFHHQQPPFIMTIDFFRTNLADPGGFSQWLANLCMQSFHSPFLGPLVFFGLVFIIWILTLKLINNVHQNSVNVLLALLPFALSIVLVNNYNFPLSVIISVIFVLSLSGIISGLKIGILWKTLLMTAGAVLIYYLSGGAYLMLYSIIALFLTLTRGNWKRLIAALWILVLAILIPLLDGGNYLWFFPEMPYFMAYEASFVFYIFLLSVPFLLLLSNILGVLKRGRRGPGPDLNPVYSIGIALALIIGIPVSGHLLSYRSDARKIVASDYYAYHQDAAKTARAATSMENYSFSANVNYVLAISRNGTLTADFFDFFQVSGSDALHPDVEFSPEMLFIAADFYYDLGFISEARHNAYEALVYYPYSPRALQLLLKVHLVCGEYRAAERCLFLLEKGLVSRKMLNKYRPFVEEPDLITSNGELMEKRSLIPEEKELSPYADQRFRELLDANPGNKLAYEYLMLYYLLDGNLDSFRELYKDVSAYFEGPVGVYEEALLMYEMMYPDADSIRFQVSMATKERFEKFSGLVKQYEGDRTMARNVLYWEMGQTYMYYLGFLYPRIVKPVRVKEDYEEAPI